MNGRRPAPQQTGGAWGTGQSRKRRWITRIAVVGGFIVFILVVAFLANKGWNWFQEKSDSSTTTLAATANIQVVVDPNMTASEIGKLLQDKGVIDSSSDFVDLVTSRGTAGSLHPGTYKFAKGEKLLDVVDMLEQGSGSPSLKVTIPEGLAIDQIADRLESDGTMDGTRYKELAATPGDFVLPKVGGTEVKVTTLEGLLFPDTYYLVKGQGPTDLIGAQLAAFTSKTASLPWDKAAALGVTPYQIVIVASLIEKEASVADERAKIAAVIYNRLKAGMTLGIDATVRYAVGKWTGTLTSDDLAVDSPYNTRVHKGLPPTPIANPGVAALQAALQPADVDYLYYVLQDTAGHHFFTASYDEFLKAKEKAPSQ
jgi:UPF0755 protein